MPLFFQKHWQVLGHSEENWESGEPVAHTEVRGQVTRRKGEGNGAGAGKMGDQNAEGLCGKHYRMFRCRDIETFSRHSKYQRNLIIK